MYGDLLLTEGHISSCDVNKLAEKVQDIFGDKIVELSVNDPLKGIHPSTTFTIYARLSSSATEEESEKLAKVLSLFGYVNTVPFTDTTLLQLEPKFPVDVTDILTDNTTLYHISQKKYDTKILKYGLGPRTSKITLSCPGERVYLLFLHTKDLTHIQLILKTWKGVLARDKKVNTEDMTIWAVRKQPGVIHYHDDTTTVLSRGVVGVFVKSNLHPEFLSKID